MGKTVVIVDDQAAFRVVARQLLEAHGFTVVGEAGDGAEARLAVRELRPDVVLLDVRLPGEGGTEVALALRALPEPPLVVLTSTGDYAHAVEQCGATAFIPKFRLSGATLLSAIEAP